MHLAAVAASVGPNAGAWPHQQKEVTTSWVAAEGCFSFYMLHISECRYIQISDCRYMMNILAKLATCVH